MFPRSDADPLEIMYLRKKSRYVPHSRAIYTGRKENLTAREDKKS